MSVHTGAVAQDALARAPTAAGRRSVRLGPFGRHYWPIWLGLLLALGLGLRLATNEAPALGLGRWLPWLQAPTVTLYFPDQDGRLVPVARRVAGGEATPRGAVGQLLLGPRDRTTLAAVLPPEAQLARFELGDGNALVELTDKLSPLAQTALARTLLDFSEVKSVRVVSPGAAPIESTSPGLRPIYYANGSYLVPVWAPAASPGEALQLYLGNAGAGSGLTGLPSDVRLLEFRLDSQRGLAYVSFTYTDSLRELAIAEPALMRRILIGIVATLTEFPQVKAVKLDFQGHTTLGLGQCSDLLRAPQARPAILNDEASLAAR